MLNLTTTSHYTKGPFWVAHLSLLENQTQCLSVSKNRFRTFPLESQVVFARKDVQEK